MSLVEALKNNQEGLKQAESGNCYFCTETTSDKNAEGQFACMDCQDVDNGGGWL